MATRPSLGPALGSLSADGVVWTKFTHGCESSLMSIRGSSAGSCNHRSSANRRGPAGCRGRALQRGEEDGLCNGSRDGTWEWLDPGSLSAMIRGCFGTTHSQGAHPGPSSPRPRPFPFLKTIPLPRTCQISFQSISAFLLSFQTFHFHVRNVAINPARGTALSLSIRVLPPSGVLPTSPISLRPPCAISVPVTMTDLRLMLFLVL